MPADAYVQDADMKKVADAIRKKSKKPGAIRFPDGFVSEIDGLGGVEVKVARLGKQETGSKPNVGCDIVMGSYVNSATFFDVTPQIWSNTPGRYNLTVGINGITDTVPVDVTAPVYGICIDESVSDPYARVTYTDNAVGMTPANKLDFGSWGEVGPFKGIKPVVRFSNGTWKELNKRNLAQCTDGSASNISSLGNDAFTEFPRWYISMKAVGKKKYIRFCKSKLDDTYHCMHAMDNGKVRPNFHVGCYCAYNSNSRIYSSSGKTPTGRISTRNFAAYSQARGAGFDQFSWYPWNYIACLFILAYKSTDSQKAMARGNDDGSSVQTESRTTFDNDFGLAGSTSATEQMSFLWLQNLWGNMYQFIGGAKTNSQNQLMAIQNGNNCSTSDSAFTQVGSGGNTSGFGGWLSEVDCANAKVGLFPKATSGSSTTYWCDGGDAHPSYFPVVGGGYAFGDSAGLFRMNFYFSATETSSFYGSRLMYKGGRE